MVLLQVFGLFALMIVGFAVGKLRIVDSSAIKGMSNLIVKATLPALILMSLQRPFSRELLGDSALMFAVSLGFYAGMMLISSLVARALGVGPKKAGALAFALAFSNCGFIGFPVVTSILGEDALFLTSIHNCAFNLIVFTVGILIISGAGSGAKISSGDKVGSGGKSGSRAKADSRAKLSSRARFRVPVKNIFNVNVVAAIVGFILFVASITIPRFLALPLNLLGGVTTPLAMVVTGAMLSRIPLKSAFGDWRLYAASALRLAVWPLLTAGALTLLGIGGQIKYITVIIAAMPAASNTSLIAEVYGGDTDTASSIVCLTTLLSVVTIPIMALMLA